MTATSWVPWQKRFRLEDGVGRCVKQFAEHDHRSPAQPLPADAEPLIVALPAHRGEVPVAQALLGT